MVALVGLAACQILEGPVHDFPPARPSGGCGTEGLAAGLHARTLSSQGQQRSYQIFVPAGHEGPLPVVFNFHGFTSDGALQRGYSRMDVSASAHGYLAVYPEGVVGPEGTTSPFFGEGTRRFWAAGSCCGPVEDAPDDVLFFRQMRDALAAEACLDTRRVYVTGMSNGGFMAQRIACDAADVVAAAGSVTGVLGVSEDACKPSRPIPILQIFGGDDPAVPYSGETRFITGEDSFAAWGRVHGCASGPVRVWTEPRFFCEAFSGCAGDAEVQMCLLPGMGHCWPGPARKTTCSEAGTALDANDRLWSFFSRHALRD